MEASICGSVGGVDFTGDSTLAELDAVSFVLLQLIAINATKLIATACTRFFMSECFVGKSQKPYQTIFSFLAWVADIHAA